MHFFSCIYLKSEILSKMFQIHLNQVTIPLARAPRVKSASTVPTKCQLHEGNAISVLCSPSPGPWPSADCLSEVLEP